MKKAATVVVCIGLLGLSGWLLLNRQLVVDYVSVWQYQPTSQIEQLAADTTMTDHGTFLFYVAHPKLDGTRAFNDACQKQEEGSAILGCYNSGKIFVYDIQDARLEGVEEVTAAHEMLHVAYERLSASERSLVDKELEIAYEAVADSNLQERMEYYARTEPNQRANELHSILGTEFATLTPVLEAHYKTYFTDRQKLVSLHDSYSDRFSDIADNVAINRQKIERLSTQITELTASYNKDSERLNANIEQFNSQAESGGFANQDQFNQARSSLLAEVERLNGVRSTIDAKVTEYEQLRARYNELVDESNSMQKALDSSLAPAPSF